MRYEVTAAQIKHYAVHKTITFEQFLSPKEKEHISHLVDKQDVWKEDLFLRKFLLSTCMGDILFAFTEKNPIRLIMDISSSSFKLDLNELPFVGLLGYFVIQKGEDSITFFDATVPIDITTPSYLALYGEHASIFVEKEHTPFAYALKKRGYVYGDRLKNEDFPYVKLIG